MDKLCIYVSEGLQNEMVFSKCIINLKIQGNWSLMCANRMCFLLLGKLAQ